MKTLINQPVCQSRNNHAVVKFLTENDLNDNIVRMINEGQIWGVYYDREMYPSEPMVVAEDIWGHIHEDILK